MARLPRNVVLLSVTSFLADISSEMMVAILPFLLLAQGATGLDVGLTGGVSEAIGNLLKPVFGALADRTRRRKPLVLGGYLLAAVSRYGIAGSATWEGSLVFRSADRVGKGMREAPRDALLSEAVTPQNRGRAFGFHRAADTAGAVVGVSLALVAVLVLHASETGIVVASATIGLATAIPLLLVRDEGARDGVGKAAFEPVSPRYRRYLVVAGLFALGNVSYLFFLLRAREEVGGVAGAVALYLLFNIVYAAMSYPAGALADRVGKARVLALGFGVFVVAALLMAAPPSAAFAIAGFVALGVAFGCVDGVQRALAADLSGSRARSTRMGIFQMTVGVSTVAGSVVAGLLWDRVAPWAAFAWGAAIALVAMGALAALGFLSPKADSSALRAP